MISKVNNDGESDQEVKRYLFETLLESLESTKILNNKENFFVRQVLLGNQLEIFSNPRRETLINDTQKNHILRMINALEYWKNEKDLIRARIDRTQLPRLNEYVLLKFKVWFDLSSNV